MNRIESLRVAVLAGLLAGSAVWLSPPARAADVPAAAAPASRPATSTCYDLHRRRLTFNRLTLSDAYKAVGKRDPAWDDKAVAFLDHMAEQFSHQAVPEFYRPTEFYSHKQGLPDGAALVAGGCDDPLVLYCYAAMLMDSGAAAEALPVLRQDGAGLRRAGYPPFRVAAVSGRLARLTVDKAEAAALTARARVDYVNACAGPQAVPGRQALVGIIWDTLDDRAAQQAFVAALAAKPDADPWILGVASGRLHIKLAWDSRGSGWANTVTEEGWKGFYAHLKQARDDLAGAWKADPALPEAPTEMITVCMGAGSELNESPLDWFGRALAAQVDDERPYQLMLYGPLQPRWGGSHEAMMQLGDACLARPRFDTVVPWQYVYAVKSVGIDAGRPWELLKDPAVYDKVAAVCDGYLKAPPSGRQDGFWRSGKAAAAWKVGRWADARKALDAQVAGGGTPVAATFGWFGADDGETRVSEVYARTGPRAADAAAAETAAEAGNLAAAAAKLRAASGGLVADDPAARYFSRRSARLDAEAKFAAGDWSPLAADGGPAGWKEDEGRWTVDGQGKLSVVPAKPGWSRMKWTDPLAAQLGDAFEVSGTIRFQPGVKPGPDDYSAGVFVFGRGNASPTVYVGLRRPFGLVTLNCRVGGVKNYPRKLSDSPAFRVRVAARTVTVWVDGEQVGDPYPFPGEWRSDVGFAVGGHGAAKLAFEDLKVRKLADGEGAAPGAGAGGDDKKAPAAGKVER